MKILLLFLFTISISYSQVRIETYNDSHYLGYVIEKTNKKITIKTTRGYKVEIAQNTIRLIEEELSIIKTIYGVEYEVHIYKENDSLYIAKDEFGSQIQINKSEIRTIKPLSEFKTENYISFGPYVGMPGVFNLSLGYHTGNNLNYKIKLGSPIIYGIGGVQLSFGYSFTKMEYFEQGVNLVGGLFEWSDSNYQYVGVTYGLNIYGIELNLGLAGGAGSFTNPQILFEFGYIWRFN